MRAGTLRERVTIVAPTTESDGEWGARDSSTNVATVSASVIARSGTEATADQGVSSIVIYDVVMRYRTGISSINRLTWNGKTLEVVTAIDPDGRRRQLNIEAREIQ